MKRQKRKILLFIDNATSHPHLEFSNIELKFFPANCTSQLQPMDQGIIQSMKLSYRKLLLLDLLSRVDSCDSGQGLIKSITVKHAMYWAAQAWEMSNPKLFRNVLQMPDWVSMKKPILITKKITEYD